MSEKENIPESALTTTSGMSNWLLKRVSDWNVFGSQTSFKAKILTTPVPLQGGAANATGGGGDAATPIGTYVCMVRILNRRMAHHKFLEDPCELADATDPAYVSKLLSLHTRMSIPPGSTGGAPMPAVNDIVDILLEPGESCNNPYDLQIGKFSKIRYQQNPAAGPPERCTSLDDAFENSPYGFQGGAWSGDFTEKDGQTISMAGAPYANNLRCYMRALNDAPGGISIREKNVQMSNGGDLSSEMAAAAASVFTTISQEMPGLSIRVTSGNDAFHHGLSYVSRHRSGRAVDFVLSPSTAENVAAVEQILYRHAAGNDPNFRFLNEYANPTKAATGKHFHISWGKGTEGSSKLKTAKKLADAGTIVPITVNTASDLQQCLTTEAQERVAAAESSQG